MSNPFFDHPILNSPFECPSRHWELDTDGQPTQKTIETRRRAEFITPIPKPKKRKKSAVQEEITFDEGKGLSTKEQQYDPTSIINEVRQTVDTWRSLPNFQSADLAALYGVATKVFNQAVKRNRERFPVDFMFQLTAGEWETLRSQTVTASSPRKGMRSQIVTASRRNVSALPYAFTEQGVAMLSSVLRSPRVRSKLISP